MPEISRFFGIVITMHYNEHPPPHFHARYAGGKMLFGIRELAVLEGSLSPRAIGLVAEWAAIHQEELLANWERAREQQPLEKIIPLD